MDWQQRIRAVLDAGGPTMVYQPIVDLWTREPIAYEALARFPGGPPSDYFEAAHECDLFIELEARCIVNALPALRRLPRRVALGVNACELLLLAREEIELPIPSPNEDDNLRLIVEISEHRRISEYERLAEALAPLRVAGVRVSVDDVGAGYASLRHVLSLAPDSLKLDRAFVKNIDQQPAEGERALLSVMAGFAARTSLRLIAEGVETEAEAMTLRSLGVKYGQGFLYGEPRTLDQL